MVDYVSVEVDCATAEVSEVVAALLAECGFEGFEELPGKLVAYVRADGYAQKVVEDVCSAQGVTYRMVEVPGRNWNAVWESNFEPVVVDGFCTVLAHFHDMEVDTPYRLLITPKMSFGTGHHDTTRLMVGFMRDIDFVGKRVFDFGTGTGILAILAEKLGAKVVYGIDNEEWAVENARENAANNGCAAVAVDLMSDPRMVASGPFDVVLANINRNVLTEYMPMLRMLLADGGALVLSGLLHPDFEDIGQSVVAAGMRVDERRDGGNWLALRVTIR
jgi:ribosomal protein L11 methyltransferase